MPVHDWTRVSPGTFHDFHGRWITHLSESLNAGLLPAGYYALSEQPAEEAWPDVLALEATATKQRTLVIRHASGDRIVALLEIVSPGNKDRRFSVDRFVDKAVSALRQNYHLLIVDLFPPGRHDPQGIHGAIWAAIDGVEAADFRLPPDRPLTLAAYEAKPAPTAYIEPIQVGASLPDMPLFIQPGWYVNVPLETTYLAAWRGVPERWRKVIEGASGSTSR